MKHIRNRIIYLIIFVLITSITEVNPSQNIDNIPTVQAASQEIPEWNIQCLNAENSYEESRNLKKIKVALLDSGLDYDPDIPFAEREDFLGADDLSAIFQDYTGHGTSAASLICAAKNDDSITGIAANVELYSARILDENNQAPVSRVIDAIKWAMEKKVNIIHMSFGTKRYSKELHDIVQKAYDQGILIIAPAGNDGTAQEDESTVEYPAAFPCVIAVGATNTSNVKTELSSSGEEMDLVAPGEQILSTGSFGGVIVAEGTSMAAAQVTGIAAVLWGKYPDKSNQFIRELLLNSANKTVASGDCRNGLADYAQSEKNYKKMNSVYRTFKKMGRSEEDAVSNAGKSLPQNTNNIDTHKEINYVNGAWKEENHNSLVTDAKKDLPKEKQYKEISTYIKIIKKGAVEPDTIKATKTLSVHPSFHGGNNFIANTEYLFRVAKLYLESKKWNTKITLPKYEDVFHGREPFDLKKMKNKDIRHELIKSRNTIFEEILKNETKKDGKDWTNKKKGYALLGIAIHNATDAFSHQAYKKGENGIYMNIVHPSSALKSKNAKKNSAVAIWEDYVKVAKDNNEKTFFKNLIRDYAIADNTDFMKPFYNLSQIFVTYSFYNIHTGLLFDAFNQAFVCYDEKCSDGSFKLANVNTYWYKTYGRKNIFSISHKVKDIEKPKIKADAAKSKLNISITPQPGYNYIVVWETNKSNNKNQKRQYLQLSKTGTDGQTFSVSIKKIKYKNLVVYSYLEGRQKRFVINKKDYTYKVIFKVKNIKHLSKKNKNIVEKLTPKKKTKKKYNIKCDKDYKISKWYSTQKNGTKKYYKLPVKYNGYGKLTLKPEVKPIKKKSRKGRKK